MTNLTIEHEATCRILEYLFRANENLYLALIKTEELKGENSEEAKALRECHSKVHEQVVKASDAEMELLEKIQEETMEKELQESIRRAREVGVPEEYILKTDEDLDRYFTE